MTEAFSPTAQPAVPPAAAWKSTEALKLLNGDSELLRELCQIFLTESPKLMQKLQQALLEKDFDALMRAAHSLKGEVSYLGAPGAMLAAAARRDRTWQRLVSRRGSAHGVAKRDIHSSARIVAAADGINSVNSPLAPGQISVPPPMVPSKAQY